MKTTIKTFNLHLNGDFLRNKDGKIVQFIIRSEEAFSLFGIGAVNERYIAVSADAETAQELLTEVLDTEEVVFVEVTPLS